MFRSIESYAEEVKRLLSIPSLASLASISQALLAECHSRLQASNNSMLPSTTHILPTGQERGEILALDVGGSTLRLARVHLTPEGGAAMRSSVASNVMDSTIRSLKGKSFFDWLAQRVHAFCQHETTTTPLIINIGVAWAFPLTQTSSGENLLLPMGKSFSASEGLEGQNLATLIESACAEVGLDVKVTGVVNDSQAALLSYAYSDPTTRISLILGTGCNAAVYLDDGLMGPGKAPCRPKASHSVVNTELGMLGQSYTLPTTRWDEHLNRVHPRPDFQPLEYRVSGLYLGEVVRLVLSEGIASGVLFGGNAVMSLETPYNLDAGLLSIFIEDQKSARSLFLEKHPVGSHEDADWEFVRLVINLVWMRAQALVAAALFALANLIDDGKKYEKLTIACHGTVIERAPGFREGVQCCLDSLCGRSERLKLELAPESSIFGAAVAAVVETG